MSDDKDIYDDGHGFRKKPERNVLFTTLEREVIDAGGQVCSECHDTAPGDKLFVYSTVRGARRRQQDGAFCSKLCHDVWHGLTSYWQQGLL